MKRFRLFSVCSAMAALLITAYSLSVLTAQGSVYASARVHNPAPSTGFDLLSSRFCMDRTGLIGEEIIFSPEDFERALNLSSLTALTVTELPPITDGELRLGSACVKVGQTIPRGDVERLSFVPAHGEVRDSSFRFCVGDLGYSIRCVLHLTDRLNAAPAVETGHLIRGICEHMSYRGILTVTDPEGDATRCLTVIPPIHGSLIWLDAVRGEYCYTPSVGFAGEDHFAVVAVDAWGNTSAQSRVSVHVGTCGVE